jgi:hypothetical protein
MFDIVLTDEYHSLMGQSNEYENYNLSTSGHMTSNQPRNVRPSASFASRVSRFGPDTHKTQPVQFSFDVFQRLVL